MSPTPDDITPSDQASSGLGRREVMIGAAAVAAAAVLASNTPAEAAPRPAHSGARHRRTRPNILMIMVDEMRYPKVFPAGITNAGEFLAAFMPNTYSLWQRGVKFANHHSAANDCSPSRGVLFTGLYAQQTWLTTTIVDPPTSKYATSPVLNRRYPTYGKLLREAGYQTPYIGKWHLSVPQVSPSNPEESLELYGFDGMTLPDPTGGNLQGTYGGGIPTYLGDGDVADQAANWLSGTKPGDQPWCLTVGFVNPHDKEFFPAGTEYETFSNLFADSSANPNGLLQYFDYTTQVPATYLNWADNALKSPPSYGYPAVPPNWESMATLAANKPSYQQVVRQFQAMIWGGVSDDPNQTDFTVTQYPQNPDYAPNVHGIGVAPYSYWQRSLDSYTQIMSLLDERVGQVLDALPADVAENTIVMFTSDHGDFSGAHGLVSGKTGTVYDEAIRVPLIVADGTGRFARDTDIVRTGLTSAVDMLPLIVSLGHGGSDRWMRGDMRKLYETRHDMLPMLRSSHAKGRKFALHTNDEIMTPTGNFLNAPNHVIGTITRRGKLGLYSYWLRNTVQLDPEGYEMEYYDYATEGGRLEVDNTSTSNQARKAEHMLRRDLLRHELRRPLPRRFRIAQEESQLALQAFLALVKDSAGGP